MRIVPDLTQAFKADEDKRKYAEELRAAAHAADAAYETVDSFIRAENAKQQENEPANDQGELQAGQLYEEKDGAQKLEGLSDRDVEIILNSVISTAALTTAQLDGVKAVTRYFAEKTATKHGWDTATTQQTATKLNNVFVKVMTSAVESNDLVQANSTQSSVQSAATNPAADLAPAPKKDVARKIIQQVTPSQAEVDRVSKQVDTTFEKVESDLNSEVAAEKDEYLTTVVNENRKELLFASIIASALYYIRREIKESPAGYGFFNKSFRDHSQQLNDFIVTTADDLGIDSSEANAILMAMYGNLAEIMKLNGILNNEAQDSFGYRNGF